MRSGGRLPVSAKTIGRDAFTGNNLLNVWFGILESISTKRCGYSFYDDGGNRLARTAENLSDRVFLGFCGSLAMSLETIYRRRPLASFEAEQAGTRDRFRQETFLGNNLETIVFSNGVITIGEYVFGWCHGVKNLEFDTIIADIVWCTFYDENGKGWRSESA